MSKRTHKAGREIKRNITGYLEGGRRRNNSGAAANALFFALAALACVLLPLSLFSLAAGAVFRVPDLLSFALDQSGAAAEVAQGLTPDAVSGAVADYMTHKENALILTVEIARRDVAVFSFMDEVNLERVRAALDRTLYPSAIGFALAVCLLVIVRLSGRPRGLKYAMRASSFVFLCGASFVMALAFSESLRVKTFAAFLGVQWRDGDALPRLLGGLYPALSGGAACLLALIVFIILHSLSRRFIKERETMFS